MREGSQIDLALLKMPSFKAMRSFVAAARYRSFTRAAEALCVTQAAISRQIRDLEVQLGTELFIRAGREIRLTPSGAVLFDAAQLSLLNIFQTTQRIRRQTSDKHSLTLCCTHALSALCLSHRLKDFFAAHPDIGLNVITTEHFLGMEPGIHPDIFISQALADLPGYQHIPLFHEVIYPVCTPHYLQAHPDANTLDGIRNGALLDLNPYGRSQLTEQMDWNAWFAFQSAGFSIPLSGGVQTFSSNDYSLLIQMALDDQGIVLGWHHLVRHLLQQGRLVRPVTQELALKEEVHYLVIKESKVNDPACIQLKDWLMDQFSQSSPVTPLSSAHSRP